MAELRFNVFGKLIAVAPTSTGWQAYLLGQDGKRSPMDVVIPAFVEEREVAQYLADLLPSSPRHRTTKSSDSPPIDAADAPIAAVEQQASSAACTALAGQSLCPFPPTVELLSHASAGAC